MNKYTLFTITLLSLILAGTGCGKKAQDNVSEAPAADVAEVDEKAQIIIQEAPVVDVADIKEEAHNIVPIVPIADATENSEQAQDKDPEKPAVDVSQDKGNDDIVINYCSKGNCRCGDGACSAGSYCIKDMCICGAHPDKGVIDYYAIASNNFGEFVCVSYKHLGEGYGGDDYFYDFLCTNDKGCVTGYGEKYSKSVDPDDLVDADSDDNLPFEERVYQKYRDTPELHIADTNSNIDDEYREILTDRYLNLNCGKKLPDELKIFNRGNSSHSLIEFEQFLETASIDLEESSWIEPECSLRKACNDSGVTQEHIAEYVCDNAKEIDSTGYYSFVDKPVGLRCNRADGCTCGSTHCPEHALCRDGQCMYDLYYQHRVCPGNKWNQDKGDIYNYISQHKKNLKCDCLKDESFELDEEVCYGMCYWELYPSKMTRNNPCSDSKKNNKMKE